MEAICRASEARSCQCSGAGLGLGPWPLALAPGGRAAALSDSRCHCPPGQWHALMISQLAKPVEMTVGPLLLCDSDYSRLPCWGDKQCLTFIRNVESSEKWNGVLSNLFVLSNDYLIPIWHLSIELTLFNCIDVFNYWLIGCFWSFEPS